MRRKKLFIIGILLCVLPAGLLAQGITFTFANGEITGTSPKFYEFDVMVQADEAGSYIGDLQVYINYNTLGFEESVNSSGYLTVQKAALIDGDIIPGVLAWWDLVVADNSSSRFSVAAAYNAGGAQHSALPTSPTELLHISIQIENTSQSADLTFQNFLPDTLMNGQQYQ